jgi:selenocysteine-specific translation elongation factor
VTISEQARVDWNGAKVAVDHDFRVSGVGAVIEQWSTATRR